MSIWPPSTSDITVRYDRDFEAGWFVRCADCRRFYFRDTWESAMWEANAHASSHHGGAA